MPVPKKFATSISVYPGPTGGSNPPWNGQGILSAPPVDYLTPNVKPPAEEMNYDLFVRDQNAIDYGVTVSAIGNWGFSGTGAWGGAAVNSAWGWDPAGRRWVVVAGINSTTTDMFTTRDSNQSWHSITSAGNITIPGGGGDAPSPFAGPLVFDTKGGLGALAFASSFGDQKLYYVENDGSVLTVASAFASTTGMTLDCFLDGTNSLQLFGWTQTGGAFTGEWVAVASGATATAKTSSLPTAFQSGTNHVGAIIAANNRQSEALYGFHDGGNLELVAICGATVVTDQASLMLVDSAGVATLLTGATITSMLSGKVIRGLAWSTNDQLWGCFTVDNANNSHLWVSADAMLWEPIETFTGLVPPAGCYRCLANVGSVWAVMGTAGAWFGDPIRVMYSATVGAFGSTSKWDSACVLVPASPLALMASPSQMAIFATNGSTISQKCFQVDLGANLGFSI